MSLSQEEPMAITDRTNPFADSAEASWHSACYEEISIAIGGHVDGELAQPEPEQGTGDSPTRAA